MHRRTLACWTSLMTVASMFVSVAPGDVVLVKEGAAVARIYIDPAEAVDIPAPPPVGKAKPKPPTNSPLVQAAADLNYHVERMSGAKLEVVQEADPSRVSTPAIILGSLAARMGAKPEPTQWQESYRIQVRDGRVLIAGERPEATVYGIYAFLRSQGCDWVMPGKAGEVIPSRKTIDVKDTDQAVNPDYVFRWMWIGGGPKYMSPENAAEFELWKKRQQMGWTHEMRRRGHEAHMWQDLPRKYKDEFEKDPTMYALVRNPDGTYERKGPQVETTHPKVIELVCRYIDEKFQKEGWPADEKVTIAMGPADGLDYSESPESLAANSRRMDAVLGGYDITDLVVKLANDVLDRIGNKYPNLSLSYYIYSVHGHYPAKYTPNPRIYPIFAPIAYSRLHSTNDPKSKTRAYYREIVEKWSELSKKQGNRLMVYEYNWNLADNILPFTRVRMIAEDLKYYHEKGVNAFVVQAIKGWAMNAPHDYIYARMLWDTSLDWKALLREYCQKAFGPAAPELEQYYLALADQQRNAGQEAGSYYSAPLIFDVAFMKSAREKVNAALAKSDLTPEQRERITYVDFALKDLELYLAWNEGMNSFDFAKAKEAGDALQANFDAALKANSHLQDRAGGIYIQRLLMESTRESLKYSSGDYRIVHKLPDELPTCLDPTSSGEHLNLFGNEINDAGWIRTRTYSSTWDAQGLIFFREGSVWYRNRFVLPADQVGAGVGLLLGAFEDEAIVWLNGVKIGTSGIKFPRPAAFDLTDAIKPGAENVLTIQVKRNSMANELGTGGILRPGFVFTGPRLPKAATTQPAVQERVLPGGETEKVVKPKK